MYNIYLWYVVFYILEPCAYILYSTVVCITSPFREQNNMLAENRTCEQFCVCDSHAWLSH